MVCAFISLVCILFAFSRDWLWALILSSIFGLLAYFESPKEGLVPMIVVDIFASGVLIACIVRWIQVAF